MRSTRAPGVRARVLCLVLVLAGTVGCTGGPQRADLGRPTPSVAAETARDEAGAELVSTLSGAIGGAGDLSQVPVAGPSTRRTLRMVAHNVRALRLEADLRYLSPSATTLSDGERTRWGRDAWSADVQVSWRVGGVDATDAVLVVPMVLSGRGAEQHVASLATTGATHVPLWLQTRLAAVRRARSVSVAPTLREARALSRLAERAVTTVRDAVPAWRSTLLVQGTPDQGAFRVAAGLPAEQARAVAAVTTTPDGTAGASSEGQVFVNPRLFEPLGQDGRQIVISHETAHVALGAATTTMPLWLSEGTADYVALRRSPIGTERLAAQVLAWVRDSGGPRRLPTASAFDGSDRRIGAWYEAAWLAVRLLAETYGEAATFRFYRAARRSGSVEGPLAQVLDTNVRDFTRSWRRYLRSLA